MNIGERNRGFYNVGDQNRGGFNVGSLNVGDRNIGDYNIGNDNTGNKNRGERNSGDYNMGNDNSGDFNLCDNSSGVFCTEQKNIHIFDEPSLLTIEEWRNSPYYKILQKIRTVKWIETRQGGYLLKMNFHESCKAFWRNLTEEEKQTIVQMPNFNAKKFLRITGINVCTP